MPESQGRDDKAGDDLVADAEKDRSVEHVVGQTHRGSHGDHVAGEQRQIHAELALGHTIAHGGDAACDLGHPTGLARRVADDGGIGLIGLVGRQHVVVGRDYAQIERLISGELGLVGRTARGKTMSEVAAGQRRAINALGARLVEPVEIGAARGFRTPGDSVGHILDCGLDGHGRLLSEEVGGYPSLVGAQGHQKRETGTWLCDSTARTGMVSTGPVSSALSSTWAFSSPSM